MQPLFAYYNGSEFEFSEDINALQNPDIHWYPNHPLNIRGVLQESSDGKSRSELLNSLWTVPRSAFKVHVR